LDSTATTAHLYAGVDVSKDRLDVCLRRGEAERHNQAFFVPHDDSGIDALVSSLVEERPMLVLLEATGGFERAVVAALATAGLAVVVVNPRQVRDFARATGRLAKTDALDAAVLARFAEALRPNPKPLPDEEIRTLQAILARRRQLLGMLTAEKNRFHSATKLVAKRIAAHLRWLEKELERVGLPPGSRMRSRHSIRRPPAVKRMPTIKSGGTNPAAYLVAAKLSPKKTAARISEISVISAALLLLSVMAPKSTAEAQRSPARGPSWSQSSPLTAVNGRESASNARSRS
jgi:hypothetical protein